MTMRVQDVSIFKKKKKLFFFSHTIQFIIAVTLKMPLSTGKTLEHANEARADKSVQV